MSHSTAPGRVAPAVALLLVAASLVPLGAGQAPDSCEAPDCLRIESLAMEQAPVVAQGDNKITGHIMNEGSTPLQARAYIQVEAGDLVAESSRALYTIPAGAQETVPMSWNGPSLDANDGTAKFTLVAWVEAAGQEVDDTRQTMSITRAIQYNDFTLELLSEPPDFIDRGETATIAEVKVTNTGNVADTAVLSVSSDDGWGFTVTPDEAILQPGKSQTVYVDATAPGDEDSVGSTADLTLEARSSELRAENPDQGLSRLRDALDLTTPTVEDGDNLRTTITSIPEESSVEPGNSVEYTVEVYNPTGASKSATIEFGSDEVPDSDVTFDLGTQQATIASGAGVTFLREAVVSDTAFAGDHAWWVKTTEGAFENQQTLALTVEQVHEVNFTVDAPLQDARDVAPGDELQEMLALINLGNGDVEICVVADLPTGWTPVDECLDVGRSLASDGASKWNETQPFTWSVQTPTSAPVGEYEIPLYVTDGVAQSESQTITFNILEQTHPILNLPLGDPKPLHGLVDPGLDPEEGPTLQVLQAPCIFGVEPGQMRTVTIGLGNEGNVDGDFSLKIDVADEQGFWTVTDPEAEHALAKGAQKSVSFDVEAPELATPEDFVEISLLLEEVDENGDAVPGRSTTATCLLGAAYPDLTALEAAPPQSPGDLYAGHPSVLHFRLLNTGWASTDGPVQVRSVIEDPDGEDLEQEHEVVALDPYPGSWWRSFDIPFNASQAGEYTYTLEVDPDHLIEEPEEEGAAPNTLTGTFVVRDFGIEVDAPTGRTAIPQQAVTFEELTDSAFVIRNSGDDLHTLTLNLTMEPAWKTFENETITLAPGEEHVVNVTFKVPAFPQAHEATITLRASNATLPSLAREDVVRVRIDDEAGPVISEVSSNVTHVLVGDSVAFSAHIVDAAGVADARLYLIAPDGTVTQYTMQGGPVFTASAAFDRIGNHTAYIWARDAAVSQNTADTSDAPIHIEVLSDDKPHVRLVDPDDGSYLRPGTPVLLTVLSKHPIVHAEYRLGDDETVVQFANPLQLATDDWPEGPSDVEVLVRDALGVEANASYAFHVDGTPPEVVDFQFDPIDASPGSTVRVEAVLEDASGIAAAEVRVGRSDGRAETFDLEHKSGSQWTAEVKLPTDVASVTVVATDLAGNRGFGERTLEGLDDVDDKGLPLPVLPLLVVPLAALWYRRRSRT